MALISQNQESTKCMYVCDFDIPQLQICLSWTSIREGRIGDSGILRARINRQKHVQIIGRTRLVLCAGNERLEWKE